MMKRPVLQCTKDEQPLKIYGSVHEAQEKYNISHISTVCKGKRRSDGGFRWYYIDAAGNPVRTEGT